MPIPPQARLAYEGPIFRVYTWPQTLFDGSVTMFEMVQRQPTTTVIAIQDGEVVYSKQEQPGRPPFLSLFGGRAEWGESPLAGAKRELMEESGLESDDWELLFEINIGGKIDWPCLYYVARNCRTVAGQHLDAGEKIELLRVPMNRFMEEIVENPNFRDKALRNHFYSALNEPVQTEFMKKLMK